MRLRGLLVRAAMALLYMGPLLAGMAGSGWAMVLPFVLLFSLWLSVARPGEWPERGEWRAPRAFLVAATLILSQTLLVAIFFGIGRGIGGVTGHLPLLHPVLPLAMSGLAIPLLRMIWDPRADLRVGTVTPAAQGDPGGGAAGEALDRLLALSARQDEGADPGRAAVRLDQAIGVVGAWGLLPELSTLLATLPAAQHGGLRRALIRRLGAEASGAAPAIPGLPRAAFAAAGQEGALLRGLLPRAIDLALAEPARRAEFPAAKVLEDLANRLAPAGGEGDPAGELRLLAMLLRAAPGQGAGARAPFPGAVSRSAALRGA
ncbi:hypothetical protein [Pseudogemmobacter sonorensis]|uniref:hypothetical protein n=1 Tax=Pseudogemmobacter sonorensis TaxID=2989681 RepID=UPI0036A20B12